MLYEWDNLLGEHLYETLLNENESTYFKSIFSNPDIGFFNCTDNISERQFGDAKNTILMKTNPVAYL